MAAASHPSGMSGIPMQRAPALSDGAGPSERHAAQPGQAPADTHVAGSANVPPLPGSAAAPAAAHAADPTAALVSAFPQLSLQHDAAAPSGIQHGVADAANLASAPRSVDTTASSPLQYPETDGAASIPGQSELSLSKQHMQPQQKQQAAGIASEATASLPHLASEPAAQLSTHGSQTSGNLPNEAMASLSILSSEQGAEVPILSRQPCNDHQQLNGQVEVVDGPAEWVGFRGEWGTTLAPISQGWFHTAETPVSRSALLRVLVQAWPETQRIQSGSATSGAS